MSFLARLLIALLLCAASVEIGQGQVAFAVATVKAAPGADPNTGSWSRPGTGEFTATHVSLTRLMQLAYGVDASQIANRPEWFDTDLFDVAAKPEEGIAMSREELQPRLQQLLQERFHLRAHRETRLLRGYALVVAPTGAHLKPTVGDHFPGFRINLSPGEMRGANWSMAIFAKYLTSAAGFPVVDRTGVSGSYDVAFSYARETDMASELPSLADALKRETGLLLKPEKVPVETIVVDAADRQPAGN
ncbi:MAG: TIGR03435 family protein [Terriglobus sp.]